MIATPTSSFLPLERASSETRLIALTYFAGNWEITPRRSKIARRLSRVQRQIAKTTTTIACSGRREIGGSDATGEGGGGSVLTVRSFHGRVEDRVGGGDGELTWEAAKGTQHS